MPEQKGREMVLSGDSNSMPDVLSTEISAYRKEVVQIIDRYSEKLNDQKMNRNRVKNRLKLLQMKDRALNSENLPDIEKELWAMALDIEEPSLMLRRHISIVIIAYTLFAFLSFLTLTLTDAIILPSFNIPYSVLMMGLVGSLVSMYVKLPNIRAREPVSYDSALWFVISPPIAVIMAGIFFGIVQIFLPVIQIQLSDESWFFWIMAWFVGCVNWVYLYDKLFGKIKKSSWRAGGLKADNIQVVKSDEKGEG
jgi:hypothetical protein